MKRYTEGPEWTLSEIEADCVLAAQQFRLRRASEPLEDYLAEFKTAEAAADAIIDQLPQILGQPPNQELLADLVADKDLGMALRYLAAPPISEDDLDTVLAVKVTHRALRLDAAVAEGLVSLLPQTIDPMRFPWIREEVEPTDEQMLAAKLSTAVVATIQRVQTKRRSEENRALETAVENLLKELGYERLPTPGGAISNFRDAPAPGRYMVAVALGGDNGDCVIGLSDGRCLALECKSSNSVINSRKRLNKEVVKDGENWRRQFGNQLVAGAVLRGVYQPRYVLEAQQTPLLIFWEHNLGALRSFIESV
ncbi:MAG TPA: XamI family restriction endonuclease [Chthonomonadaceae bacterium]|nr:XamI family restriction endonuclease [Chthonomonadaceae bacterium]